MNLTKETYIPQQAYLYFPKGAEFKSGDNQRMIFDGNTIFDKKELDSISQFHAYVKKHNYVLKPLWTDNMILRFLYANGFKMDKTLASIKEHTTWREANLPVKVDAELLKFLNSGLLYIHGRDHKFRPIVIFNVYKLDPKTVDIDLVIRAMTFWFEYVVSDWMLPGQIENWVFIVNMKGMGIAALAVQSVRKLFQYLQDNFKCRLHSLYCLNTPATIYIPWQVVKKFLDEVTVKKIQFSKAQTPTELFNITNPEQIEQQYGGCAPNVTQYWPPVVNSDKYFVSQKDKNSLITKEEYKNMYQNGQLKNMKINQTFVQDQPVVNNKDASLEQSHNDLNNVPTIPLDRVSAKLNNGADNVSPEGTGSQKTNDSMGGSYEDIDVDYIDYMDETPKMSLNNRDIKEFRTSFLSKPIVY